MAIAERQSPVRRSSKSPGPRENVLLVIVALAFLALHVLAGTFVHRALPHEPAQEPEQMAAAYGD